jgi:hypothetical protein
MQVYQKHIWISPPHLNSHLHNQQSRTTSLNSKVQNRYVSATILRRRPLSPKLPTNGTKELSKSFLTAQLAILQADINLNSPPPDPVFSPSAIAKKQLNPGPLARSPWVLSNGPIRRDHLAATQFYQWACSASTNFLERFAIVSHIIYFLFIRIFNLYLNLTLFFCIPP